MGFVLIQSPFARFGFAAQAAASRRAVARFTIGFAILIAAIVPQVGAAPQSSSENLPGGADLALPSIDSRSPNDGSTTPYTLRGKLAATPSPVNFVSVPIGLTNTQTISLVNTGNANVQVFSASIVGAEFKLLDLSTPLTISPGHSARFDISFKPLSASAFSGMATIYSNASNSPLKISMSGAGASTTVLLGVNPATLSFGNVTVGSSNTKNVSVTNSGNVSLTISKVTVPSSSFATSGVAAGLILAPSQTATLKITFSPLSVATSSGSISIYDTASGNPVKVAVSGAGVQSSAQSVSLSWLPSNSQGVTGYFIYRGTVSGGPYNVLDSSPDPSTQYIDTSVQSGLTYYYVVTSVDSSNMQSSFSSQVTAKIPAQ